MHAGIFGGYSHVEPAVSHARAPKIAIESLGMAGVAKPKADGIHLDWDNEAPLRALPSARSNHNAPSQMGGIFGAAPVAVKPAISRNDPNASSIPGGVFG